MSESDDVSVQPEQLQHQIQRLTSVVELLSIKLQQFADPTCSAAYLRLPFVVAQPLLNLLSSFNEAGTSTVYLSSRIFSFSNYSISLLK